MSGMPRWSAIRLSALSPRMAGCAPGDVMMPTGCTSNWRSRSRNARLKSDGKPANATRGPLPGVIVSGGGGRSRSGMKVKTSRAQRSRPTASRYAEEVATSIDPNQARGWINQSFTDEGVEYEGDVGRKQPGGGRTGSRSQLVDGPGVRVGEHGPQDRTTKLSGAAVVAGRMPSRRWQ